MAIDLERELLLLFDEAARYLPPGVRPAYPSWWRWYRHGIRGVKLETIKIAGRRYTTAEAVQRFFSAATARSFTNDASGGSSTQSHGAQQQAEQLLEREGI